MLIEAKAHDKKTYRSDIKNPFVFTKAEKKTSRPAWIAMALTGLFAYFKEVAIGPSVAPVQAADHRHKEPSEALRGRDIGAATTTLDHHAPKDGAAPQPHVLDARYSVTDEPALTVLNSTQQFASGFPALAPQVRNTLAQNDNAFSIADRSPVAGAHHGLALPFAPLLQGNGRTEPTSAASTSHPDGHLTTQAPGTTPPAKTPLDLANPPGKTNRAPVVTGPVRLNDVIAGQAMLLGLGDLLLGTRDADGDQLQVSNITSSTGTLVAAHDGWAYHANLGAETTATLSYDVSDGNDVVHQTADIHILSIAQTLSTDDDVYVGSPGADQIDAMAGNDIVDAGAGADIVYGGAGADHIQGGDGNDILVGGAGDDIIFGGDGNDIISGGDGADRLFGQDGNDVLSGGGGDDNLSGGAGDDVVLAGDGNDTVSGGAGNDDLNGGAGVDTLDYSDSGAAVSVDLLACCASGSDIGQDVFSQFEAIVGGSGNDLFRLGTDAISIVGGSGDDSYQVTIADAHLQISDFAVGDRIDIGAYEVMERTTGQEGPDFCNMYTSVPSDNDFPIKAQNGVCDGFDITVLEARSHNTDSGDDQGCQDGFDIYISLIGHHDLVYVLHAIA